MAKQRNEAKEDKKKEADALVAGLNVATETMIQVLNAKKAASAAESEYKTQNTELKNRLAVSVKVIEDLKKSLAELKSQRDELRLTKEGLEKATQDKVQQLNRLGEDNRVLQGNISELQQEKNKLEQSIKSLTQEKDDIDVQRKEKDILAAQVVAERDRLVTLNKEESSKNESLNQQIDQLKSQLGELTQEINMTKKSLQEKEEEINDITQKVVQKDDEITALNEVILNREDIIKNLGKDVETSKAELEKKDEQIVHLERNIGITDNKYKQSHEGLVKTQQGLDSVNAKLKKVIELKDEFEGQVHLQKIQIEEANRINTELVASLEEEKKEKATKQVEIKSLNKQLKEYSEKTVKLNEFLEQGANREANVAKDLEQTRNRLSETQAQLKETAAEALKDKQEWVKRVETLTETTEKNDKEVVALQEMIKSMQEELEVSNTVMSALKGFLPLFNKFLVQLTEQDVVELPSPIPGSPMPLSPPTFGRPLGSELKSALKRSPEAGSPGSSGKSYAERELERSPKPPAAAGRQALFVAKLDQAAEQSNGQGLKS